MYESTMDQLYLLFDKVVPGGFIIVGARGWQLGVGGLSIVVRHLQLPMPRSSDLAIATSFAFPSPHTQTYILPPSVRMLQMIGSFHLAKRQ